MSELLCSRVRVVMNSTQSEKNVRLEYVSCIYMFPAAVLRKAGLKGTIDKDGQRELSRCLCRFPFWYA